MADSRSTHRGVYTSELLGGDYRKRVDTGLFAQADLNWTDATTEPPLPNSLRPRHIVGIDASGRSHSVVIPNVSAALWTGPTTHTWTILGDDGSAVTVTPTGLVGEALTL